MAFFYSIVIWRDDVYSWNSHCTGLGYWMSLYLPKGRAVAGKTRKPRPRVPSEACQTTQAKLNSPSGALTLSLKVSLVFCHIPNSSWPSLLTCSSLNLQFHSRAKALELSLIPFLTHSPFNTSEIPGCPSKYICVCVSIQNLTSSTLPLPPWLG